MAIREWPFDFYGRGGGGRKAKKNSPACLRKRFRTPIPDFAHRDPPFALRNLLSQSKICISHSVNCFTHSKKTTLYTLGMTFRIIKRKYSALWKKSLVTPPPPKGRRKKFSCSKYRQKKFSGSLKSSCPPPP